MNKILIHVSSVNGHRASYQDLFVKLLKGSPSTGRIRGKRFWMLLRARRVLFATIDDDYIGFILVVLLRSLLFRPTIGLFLRAMQCFRTERPIVYKVKREVFFWLCKLPNLRLLSIIPYDVKPELKRVTHDWLYDPQLWDLWVEGVPVLPDTELSQRTKATQAGRKVIIFIGAGNRIKGFDRLVQLAEISAEKLLIVVAGKVNNDYKKHAGLLKELGMIVEDRYVTDNEILSLYKVADFAWCYYSKDYDQASGIFGRAIQTGVCPIVRPGSVISNEAKSITFSEVLRILNSFSKFQDCYLGKSCSGKQQAEFTRMVEHSLRKLSMED